MGYTRTNIEIDDELIAAVMSRTGASTKREAVDYALRRVAVTPMTREELLAERGARHIRDDYDPKDHAGTVPGIE